MLYKKVHRQFLRDFRVGRKYKLHGDEVVREITKKPYIGKQDNCINTDRWFLISFSTGRLIFNKDDFEWLN